MQRIGGGTLDRKKYSMDSNIFERKVMIFLSVNMYTVTINCIMQIFKKNVFNMTYFFHSLKCLERFYVLTLLQCILGLPLA